MLPCLVIASAILHPMREMLIKGNTYPEGLAFGVMLQFGLYSTIQVLVTGVDPWAALAVLPFAIISSVAVIVFYLLNGDDAAARRYVNLLSDHTLLTLIRC